MPVKVRSNSVLSCGGTVIAVSQHVDYTEDAPALKLAELGSVSSGTHKDSHLLSAFTSTLSLLRGEEEANKIDAYREARDLLEKGEDDWTEDEQDTVSEILESLTNSLDEHSPEGAYFGTSEGDGADFGFWLVE